MEEIDNTKLVELIKKMKEEKTQESQREFVSQMLKSRFYCPVIFANAPKGGGKVKIDKETKIQFNIIQATDGSSYLIAFTSEAEINKWQKSQMQQSIIYTFEDYSTIVLGQNNINGFIIDPKGENIIINRKVIEQVRSALTTEETLDKETEIELRTVSNASQDLKDKLYDTLSSIDEVSKAYFLVMKENEKETYLIAFLANGNEKEYYNKIASAAIPFLNGVGLSFMPLGTELGKQIEEKFEPFYNKEEK